MTGKSCQSSIQRPEGYVVYPQYIVSHPDTEVCQNIKSQELPVADDITKTIPRCACAMKDGRLLPGQFVALEHLHRNGVLLNHLLRQISNGIQSVQSSIISELHA